jgi:protein-S-isoprenylcysteine O-methyltransferase Ste14
MKGSVGAGEGRRSGDPIILRGHPHDGKMFIEILRFGLAVMLWATIPAVATYWLLLHGFVAYWRRVGVAATYLAVIPICLLVLGAFVRWGGGTVDRSDLGTHMGLFAGGVFLWAISVIVDRRTRDVIDLRSVFGVSQIEGARGELATDGLYARVRHPRYLSLMIATAGWAMMANHAASYLMVAALFPALVVITTLEEQELAARFGSAWAEYSRRVPRLVPRLRGGAAPGS